MSNSLHTLLCRPYTSGSGVTNKGSLTLGPKFTRALIIGDYHLDFKLQVRLGVAWGLGAVPGLSVVRFVVVESTTYFSMGASQV